jgi:hypothetical protein
MRSKNLKTIQKKNPEKQSNKRPPIPLNPTHRMRNETLECYIYKKTGEYTIYTVPETQMKRYKQEPKSKNQKPKAKKSKTQRQRKLRTADGKEQE